MVIDFQIHFHHPELYKPRVNPTGGKPYSFQLPDGTWTRYTPPEWAMDDKFVEFMDGSGIDIAVVSVMDGMRGDLRMARMVNDNLKEMEQKYPGRIYPYAHIPPMGGPEAFAELRRCHEELGYKGACIFSTTMGREVDDRELWPFFEKLVEYGMFLFIHPNIEADPDKPEYDLKDTVLRQGHLQETLVRLISGGVFDNFPGLKVVFAHLGGGIAAGLTRWLCYEDKDFWFDNEDPKKSLKSKRPVMEYLKEMWFDTAGIVGDIDPVKMALMKLPPSSFVFGTDYPYEIRDPQVTRNFINDFRKLPLKTAEIETILSGNGRKLLGI